MKERNNYKDALKIYIAILSCQIQDKCEYASLAAIKRYSGLKKLTYKEMNNFFEFVLCKKFYYICLS